MYPLDYYGKPEYRDVLMRFDFQQADQLIEPRWSDKYPGRKNLGIAPSGRFAIYKITWVPQWIRSREELKLRLINHVPPTDMFVLNFAYRYEWMRERVIIPVVFPVYQPALMALEVREEV